MQQTSVESRNRRASQNTKIKINNEKLKGKKGNLYFLLHKIAVLLLFLLGLYMWKGFCIQKTLTGYENTGWWYFQTKVLLAKPSLKENKNAENTVSTQKTIIVSWLTSYSTCVSGRGDRLRILLSKSQSLCWNLWSLSRRRFIVVKALD